MSIGDVVEVVGWMPMYGGKCGEVVDIEVIALHTYYRVAVVFSKGDIRSCLFLERVLRRLVIC